MTGPFCKSKGAKRQSLPPFIRGGRGGTIHQDGCQRLRTGVTISVVFGWARLLPSLVRPQVGVRRKPLMKPPADAQLKLVLGSAGASPSPSMKPTMIDAPILNWRLIVILQKTTARRIARYSYPPWPPLIKGGSSRRYAPFVKPPKVSITHGDHVPCIL